MANEQPWANPVATPPPIFTILKRHVWVGLRRRLAHADSGWDGEEASSRLFEPGVYGQPVAAHSGEFRERLAISP